MDRAQIKTGENVYIGEQNILGCLKETRIREKLQNGADLHFDSEDEKPPCVVVDDECIIMNQVVIFEGSYIGDRTFVQDKCRIGYGCDIGRDCRLQYGTYICDRVVIGNNSIIAGFVCDGVQIGERVTMMGVLVHRYNEPHCGWWESEEKPPTIENDAVVGYNATVVGDVTIGHHSYIAAGATVTKDVPPEHVVTGVNSHTHLREWEGNTLKDVIDEWLNSSS